MAEVKQVVNFVGKLTQFEKVANGKDEKTGQALFKKTEKEIGCHIFFVYPVSEWLNDAPRATVKNEELSQLNFSFDDLQYLDKLIAVYDVSNLGSKPKFVRFEKYVEEQKQQAETAKIKG